MPGTPEMIISKIKLQAHIFTLNSFNKTLYYALIIITIILTYFINSNLQVSKKANANYKNNEISEINIKISEINWDGSHISSYDEWIELYNLSQSSIDLSQYYIYIDNAKPDQIICHNNPKCKQLNGIISAGNFFVISKQSPLTNPDKTNLNKTDLTLSNLPNINNSKFYIALINAENNIIDEVDFSNGNPFQNYKKDTKFGRASLERINFNTAKPQAADWKLSTNSINFKSNYFDKHTNNLTIDYGTPGNFNSKEYKIEINCKLTTENKCDHQETLKIKTNVIDSGIFKIVLTNQVNTKELSKNINLGLTINSQLYNYKSNVYEENTFIFRNIKEKTSIELDLQYESNNLDGSSNIDIKRVLISKIENLSELKEEINSNIIIDKVYIYSYPSNNQNNSFTLKSDSKIEIDTNILNFNHNYLLELEIEKTTVNFDVHDTPILRIINQIDNQDKDIKDFYLHDFIEDTNFKLNYIITFPNKPNISFVKIINIDESEKIINSIKISKLNIEKYEDNINLFNSIKNAKFDKTTNGIKIKHNQNRNIIIQKNDVCILRNNCTIKFRLTNLTDKAKKIKVYFGYKDESKRQFKIQEYTLTKEQEIIFSIESTTGKNLIKIVISGDIDNLEISNLKIKYNQINSNIDIENNFKLPIENFELNNSKGLNGKLSIIRVNNINKGNYTYYLKFNKNNLKKISNYSVIKISAYNSKGQLIFEENYTEKEIQNLDTIQIPFELKEQDKLIILINYYGSYKKASTNIQILEHKLSVLNN